MSAPLTMEDKNQFINLPLINTLRGGPGASSERAPRYERGKKKDKTDEDDDVKSVENMM